MFVTISGTASEAVVSDKVKVILRFFGNSKYKSDSINESLGSARAFFSELLARNVLLKEKDFRFSDFKIVKYEDNFGSLRYKSKQTFIAEVESSSALFVKELLEIISMFKENPPSLKLTFSLSDELRDEALIKAFNNAINNSTNKLKSAFNIVGDNYDIISIEEIKTENKPILQNTMTDAILCNDLEDDLIQRINTFNKLLVIQDVKVIYEISSLSN